MFRHKINSNTTAAGNGIFVTADSTSTAPSKQRSQLGNTLVKQVLSGPSDPTAAKTTRGKPGASLSFLEHLKYNITDVKNKLTDPSLTRRHSADRLEKARKDSAAAQKAPPTPREPSPRMEDGGSRPRMSTDDYLATLTPDAAGHAAVSELLASLETAEHAKQSGLRTTLFDACRKNITARNLNPSDHEMTCVSRLVERASMLVRRPTEEDVRVLSDLGLELAKTFPEDQITSESEKAIRQEVDALVGRWLVAREGDVTAAKVP